MIITTSPWQLLPLFLAAPGWTLYVGSHPCFPYHIQCPSNTFFSYLRQTQDAQFPQLDPPSGPWLLALHLYIKCFICLARLFWATLSFGSVAYLLSLFPSSPCPLPQSWGQWTAGAPVQIGVKEGKLEESLVSSVGIARKDTCWLHCLLCSGHSIPTHLIKL